MDYDKYYLDQATIFPTYKGIRPQRGNGLGNVFKKFFRWIMPIVKAHAKPVLKSVGESVLKGTTEFAKDALDGKDLKESAKSRIIETTEDLKSKFNMKGKGINTKKRKRKLIRS